MKKYAFAKTVSSKNGTQNILTTAIACHSLCDLRVAHHPTNRTHLVRTNMHVESLRNMLRDKRTHISTNLNWMCLCQYLLQIVILPVPTIVTLCYGSIHDAVPESSTIITKHISYMRYTGH